VNEANPRKVNYQYHLNLEKELREGRYTSSPRDVLHPDLTFVGDEDLDKGVKKKDAGTDYVIDKLEDLKPKHRLDGVWTPPVAMDLNGFGVYRERPIILDHKYYAPFYTYMGVLKGWPSEANYYRYTNPGYFDRPKGNYGGDYFAGPNGARTYNGHYDGYTYYNTVAPGTAAGFNEYNIHYLAQWGPTQGWLAYAQSFGSFAFRRQWVEFERRMKIPGKAEGKPNYYKFGYNGKYTDMLYIRLSLLRPDYRVGASNEYSNFTVPKELSMEPVWGLYAIRAWDFQRQEFGIWSATDMFFYDDQDLNNDEDKEHSPRPAQEKTGLEANFGEARKRLLMVVQGLQMPYQPNRLTVVRDDGKLATGNFKTRNEARYIEPQADNGDANRYLRAPALKSSQHTGKKKDYSIYKKDRERVFGLHFWGNARSKASATANVAPDKNPNTHEINEVWFGEGFSPIEVVELLGLDPKQFNPGTDDGIKNIIGVYTTR
jgi:hypothetical protein